MATKKQNPTNKDIYTKLGEHDEQLKQIHTEVKKTNGRVGVLEVWKERQEWEAQYKREHPSKTAQEVKEGWSTREKQLIAFITALLAILATLVGTGRL